MKEKGRVIEEVQERADRVRSIIIRIHTRE